MGRKCSVENCTSDSTRPEHTGVTFHKVPHHSDVRPRWISLCRIPDDKSNAKVLYVCSRHFLRADFCSFKGKKYMLRQGVLPSVFPWDKSKLEAIKAEATTKKCVDSPKKDKLKSKRKEDKSEGSEDTLIKIEPEEKKEMDTSEIKLESKSDMDINTKEETDAFDQHQRSQVNSTSSSPINFAINSKIEVLDNSIWYTAKINEVDYEENEILIHFEKFSNKYDEWISMTSPRLRPYQDNTQETFVVGEHCMATWSDSRKFPATVTKIIDGETYEVLFDDGLLKSLKIQKISKITNTKPPQSSPLFEPIKSTKQERRDKKRKLDVAALFGKKNRLTNSDEKKGKISLNLSLSEEQTVSPIAEADTKIGLSVASISNQSSDQWHPTFENGKPIGVDSTIDTHDGIRKSVIVPDPRIPDDWQKHLTQRSHGNSAGKWDTIFVGPDGKKFRNKAEIKTYLEQNPDFNLNLEIFDFSIYRNKYKRKPKQKQLPESQTDSTEEILKEDVPIKEEEDEPPVNLKIIFENDSFKCPIEGCGKNFRRENLALMHVKHYHSEYTKYLDSTPNVADLAYARTVGENLDRSPSSGKPSTPKPTIEKISVPSKAKTTHSSNPEPKTPVSNSPNPESKCKDSEIIKLLNQKSAETSKEIQPLPSGLPSSMYPDIKLKDLLSKTEEIPMKDEINIKTLCSTRPPHGIKTLLPVRSNPYSSIENVEDKSSLKRKRAHIDFETPKGKTSYQATNSPKSEHIQLIQQPPLSSKSYSHLQAGINISSNPQSPPLSDAPGPFSSVSSAFDLPPPIGLNSSQSSPSVAQFDGVIIEGGKIIKLERMKQEEIINCTCGFTEEDGLMIQCELCLCWQHAYCNNIQKESEVPEKYVCNICQHPQRERRSMKYMHDQDWLKHGSLPVASYHARDDEELRKRFEKLKKCHDLSGGLLELREYLHALACKLKIAEAKNHPKLYLWSKPWEKSKLPEKCEDKVEKPADIKLKIENIDHQYVKNEMGVEKQEHQNESMLMMMLKEDKEDIPMLNVHNSMAPIIPKPEAAIDSDDCRLNLLDHISHAESLIEERLDDFEKQLAQLEEGVNLETEVDYPKTRQTLQLLIRDLETLKKFSELPMN